MGTDQGSEVVVARATTGEEPTGHNDAAAHVGEYAQDMLLELRKLSRTARCAYLTYLLELALIEASDLASGKRPTHMEPAVPVERTGDLDAFLERALART